MKYQVVQLLTDPAQYRITGPNCQFDFGWDRSTVAHHVCSELNRLNGEVDVQVEAKCNALRKVTDLEALGVEMELKLKGSPTNRALKHRLSVRTGQVRELLDVLERCQGILADYLDPSAGIKPRAALSHLLDILDDGAFVTRINHLSEMLKKRPLGWEIDNGSVELTKADKMAVLKALDELAGFLTKFTPMQPASYTDACRILGASEDGDVANGCQKKFPEVGDEMLVTLQRGSDGKQYVSGFGLGIEQPFIVDADQVYINKRLVLDGINPTLDKLTSAISATELGEALHESFERVVNNTTNHFAPSKKLKRRVKKLRARVSELENERDELLSEIRANAERD